MKSFSWVLCCLQDVVVISVRKKQGGSVGEAAHKAKLQEDFHRLNEEVG